MSYRLYEEAKEKFCEALAEIVEGKQRFSADDLRLAKEAISGLIKRLSLWRWRTAITHTPTV